MTVDAFGIAPGGERIDRITLAGRAGVEVSILTWGAAVHEVWIPDREGRPLNVALGFASLEEYVAHEGHYFGSVAGRYANRIGDGRFELDGVLYELSRNDGRSTLHGGETGFDRRAWRLCDAGDTAVTLAYTSPDGEMGFPGTLEVEVVYTLVERSLRIDLRARTDRPTVVNLANHTCWNLAGEGAGGVDEHVLTLAASSFTPVDERLVPIGEIASVDGTPLDFRRPVPIGARLRVREPQLELARGYDHNLVLDRSEPGLVRAAVLEEHRSGRTLEVLTTEPGLQLYTGNFLDGTAYGSSGRAYRQGDCVALETQHFPDSPNRPGFPSTTLRPGGRLESTTVFRFGIS